ncbi:MAG: glycosyltransferase family 39 protein [Candidatus Omnitrophica bacterium]|nr:glycosyltransferase family 39 protein [Candidatus Omnitrophota bacterium]
MKKGSFFWILLAVVSIFLQFYQLGERSLWEDEAQVAGKASWKLKGILLYQKNALYNIILSFWGRFGKDEFWLRIPSALFALFSLVALYELGKKLFSRKEAFLATVLLSTSPFFLLGSRQVKMESLVLFLSLVSVIFLTQFVETGRLGKLLGYIGISLMAILTHYMFFPLLLAQCIFVVISLRNKPHLILRYFAIWLLVFLLFLPSFPNLMKRLAYLQGVYLSPKTPETLSMPFGYFGKMALVYYLFTAGPTIVPWNLLWVVPATLLSGVLLLCSFNVCLRRSSRLIPLAFLFPILFLSAMRNAQPRYCFVSLPFYTLLLSTALFSLRPLLRNLFLSCLIVVNTYGLVNYFAGRQYLFITYLEPYRQIVYSVQKAFAPGDFLLHTQENPSFDYYFHGLFQKDAPQGKLHTVDRERRIHVVSWEELKNKFPPSINRLWYIERTPGQYVEATPISDAERIYRENLSFRSWLDEHFRLLDRKAYLKDLEVGKKRKIVSKLYLEERIVVSLYDLKNTP